MKKLLAFTAAGLLAMSSAAVAGEGYSCGGYQQTVQGEQSTPATVTLAPGATERQDVKQTASAATKTDKPGS